MNRVPQNHLERKKVSDRTLVRQVLLGFGTLGAHDVPYKHL